MDFTRHNNPFSRNVKSGTKRYPASEYSDRIMSLNRLEQRNLESKIKAIEQQSKTSLRLLNRDIKKLEKELELKQELLNVINNDERLKLFHANLQIVLLSNNINEKDKVNDQQHAINSNTHLLVDNNQHQLINTETNKENQSILPRSDSNLSANAKLNRSPSTNNKTSTPTSIVSIQQPVSVLKRSNSAVPALLRTTQQQQQHHHHLADKSNEKSINLIKSNYEIVNLDESKESRNSNHYSSSSNDSNRDDITTIITPLMDMKKRPKSSSSTLSKIPSIAEIRTDNHYVKDKQFNILPKAPIVVSENKLKQSIKSKTATLIDAGMNTNNRDLFTNSRNFIKSNSSSTISSIISPSSSTQTQSTIPTLPSIEMKA